MHLARGLAAALVLAGASLVVQGVEAPLRVVACSCVAPMPTLAELAQEPGTSIVVATVGQALPDRTPLAVEGWFRGSMDSDVIWIHGGMNMGTSCDIFLEAGQSYVLVLYRGEGGIYSANSCTPSGQVGTVAGDNLLAETGTLFGDAQAPPTPEPVAPTPIDLAPWPGGLAWAAAGVAIAAGLFGAIALLARRRPSG